MSPHMYSYLHRVVIFNDLSDSRNQTECCEIFVKPLGVVLKAASHLPPFFSVIAKADLSNGLYAKIIILTVETVCVHMY